MINFNNTITKAFLTWIKRLFFAGSILFFLFVAIQNKDQLRDVIAISSPAGFLFAIIFWVASIFIIALITMTILGDMKKNIPYKNLLLIYINRIPAKYLPGGVWQTFARAYDLNAMGVSKVELGVLIFYENFWSVFIATILSASGIILLDNNSLYVNLAVLALASCVIVVLAGMFLRKKSFILSLGGYIKLSLAYLLFWLCTGTSFLLYFSSLGIKTQEYSSILLVSHYLFSYVVGFITFFAPQGIGVFEVVMAELAKFEIPLVQAVVLIAGFRLVVLISDVISWTVFFLLQKSQFRIQEIQE